MDSKHVRAGKHIQRRTGKTFHLATRLLPERVRHPTYVLYGFFRICDEVVDDPGGTSPAQQRARLERLRAAALGERQPNHPVVEAFRDVCDRHAIPDAEIEAFVDSMATDASKDRYADFEDLEAYVRGSAASVGLMMMALMGPDDPERATPHAIVLGEALQLTNFLRDVREDALDRGRVYLPESTLARHGATVEDVLACEPTEGVRAAVADELQRAEHRYREGVAGIRHLPEDCQFAVLLAAILYADYHRTIQARNYDVLSAPVKLNPIRAAWLLAETRVRWWLSKDPEAVFEAVSPVGSSESHERPGEVRTSPT